jgi:hypothetical protein
LPGPLRKLGIAVGALLVALVAAELLLRRWYPPPGSNYRLDERLLHTTEPGSRRVQVMPDGARVLVRVNSSGYRGAELERPRTRPRIAVIGDSLVFAGNVPEDETFVARLGAALGGRFELVNCGLESYGPDQSCLKLEQDLPRLAPDVVVLVLCATNDYGDLLRNKLFRLEDGALVENHPELGERLQRIFAERARHKGGLAILRASRGAPGPPAGAPPDSGQLVLEYLAHAREQYELYCAGDRVVDDLQQDPYDAALAIHPDWPVSRLQRELMVGVLARLRAACGATPLVAVVVPSAVDLDPDFIVRVDPALYPSYRRDALTSALAEDATAAGIATLDLFAVFAQREPARLFVGYDDFHWNAAGQALAAREVAAFLTARQVLPE